jgi:PAS domain S-box-containing protein
MLTELDCGEQQRLAALRRLEILDTPEDAAFDRVVQLAARLFAAPMAAISFLDENREWFKSRLGFERREVPREAAIIGSPLSPDEVLVVPNARTDPRFASAALVTGPPALRFYAAAPIVKANGERTTIGVVAVGDHAPRSAFGEVEAGLLRDLAVMVSELIDHRLVKAALDEERHRAREQRRLAELIVAGTAEGIFTVDRERRCTLWNQAMAALTGIAPAKMLDRDLLAVNWPLASDRPAQALRAALHGEAVGLRDEAYRDAAGEERFFAAHLTPLYDAEGGLLGAIGFVRDTTARHELEDRLRQTQKLDAIGQLTGTVAHDFNNLLTVISGNLERALPRTQGDPRLKRMLEDIAEAAERGEALTQQLLAFARRQRLEPQPIEVNALVTRMSGMLQRTLPETVAIRLDLSPRLPRAVADQNQLEVALLNLALNASAAMPKGGTITIETRARRLARAELGPRSLAHPGRFIMMAIRDTGVGMTAEVKRRIFEPFFTTKPRGQGTGLGLSQVYGFVTQSLGHIRVQSRVGAGTTVELYLPATSAALERAATPAAGEARAGRGRGTVLVVEDSEPVRSFAVAVLQEEGYRVIEAVDAEEALRHLRDHAEIELVFSDVVMPGRRNGLELARRLRRSRPELPVILTTGYSESLADIEREGFPLLLKPYRPAQLVRTIEAPLRTRPAG